MLKDLLKIKKINKNMSLLLERDIYFFETILSEISHKKYKTSKKYIFNKYMGSSLSYSLVFMHELNKKKINKSTKPIKTLKCTDNVDNKYKIKYEKLEMTVDDENDENNKNNKNNKNDL